YGYQTADPFLYGQLKDFVKEHRSVPTEAEKIFWELIRGKRLDGYKFRRQHIIGYYIADFVCLQEKLVVEIDGLIHELPENKTSDEERTRYLNKKGFSVIRFTNNEIIGNPDGVIEKVLYHLKLCSSRNPPSGGRGAVLLSIADCTGHGVPGAFMSMIGHNLLNTLVIKNRITDPGEVLTQLNREILTALKQESGSDSQDGMDITLCAIIPDPYPDKQDIRAEVLFAGANNPLFVARNSFLQGIPAPAHGVNAAPEISLQVIDGDDFPVGGTQFNPDRTFKTHKILLGNNECIYLTTDGYIDQFGGTGRKKFMTRRFLKLLREAGGFTMEEQEKIIITEHEKWKGSDQQVDDILVAGIRF
ncbi:MAG: DUF559 domain-containing protein, partial [Bacteroidetes bacterium]|nr:DUF559 domain-containing protein [Bacteroidota bacterium]